MAPPHDSGFRQLLAKNQIPLFHDVRTAYRTSTNFKGKDLSPYIGNVLKNENYQHYVATRQRRKGMKSDKYIKKPKDDKVLTKDTFKTKLNIPAA